MSASGAPEWLMRLDGTIYFNSPCREDLDDCWNRALLSPEDFLLTQAIRQADRERYALHCVRVAEQEERVRRRRRERRQKQRATKQQQQHQEAPGGDVQQQVPTAVHQFLVDFHEKMLQTRVSMLMGPASLSCYYFE
jgi:hypothetical protein